MSLNIEYKHRQMVPRWNPFFIAKKLGETKGLIYTQTTTEIDLRQHLKKYHNWQSNKTRLYALDYIASALILEQLDDQTTKDPIQLLNQQFKHLSSAGKDIVNYLVSKDTILSDYSFNASIDNDCKPIYSSKIAELKCKLQRFPYNPIAWMDLAFYYAALGIYTKAEKCVIIALNLNNTNRYILRSATRFFLHLNKPDLSLSILRKAASTKDDPWLISAEISMSEILGVKSQYVKTGLNLSNDQRFDPLNRSELNASLSTLEYSYGNIKKAKKLLKAALISPDENVLAQAEYISKNIDVIIDSTKYNIPYKYEAIMWEELRNKKYRDALNEAIKWTKYQPFSAKPVTAATYISAVALLDDYFAISIIEKVCPSLRKEPMVLNNYVFSLANIGKIKEAKEMLSKLKEPEVDDFKSAILTATKGLVAFRSNQIQKGRELYHKAINYFARNKDFLALSRANLFLGREELLVNNKDGVKYLRKAIELATRFNLHEVVAYGDHLLKNRQTDHQNCS